MRMIRLPGLYTRTGIVMPERRPLHREGSSKKEEFPIPVQKDMGVALYVVQLGGTPEAAKPWRGNGSGVYELVEDHRGDTFRAVYTVRIGDAVHVLQEIQVWHCHAAARCGADREANEGGARTL